MNKKKVVWQSVSVGENISRLLKIKSEYQYHMKVRSEKKQNEKLYVFQYKIRESSKENLFNGRFFFFGNHCELFTS